MKKYTTPKIEITIIEMTDIITTSGTLEQTAEVDFLEKFSWEALKESLK